MRTAFLNLGELTSAYYQTTVRAPQRALRPDPYLMPTHDGRGGTNIKSREKVAAKPIFDHGRPLAIGDESVVVDYEVPLAARQADDGVGDIDLLGVGPTLGRPWIIELKVGSNTEPPYSALLQALRYSAMLDANRRQISVEVKTRTRVDLAWPAVLAVAADQEYWLSPTATSPFRSSPPTPAFVGANSPVSSWPTPTCCGDGLRSGRHSSKRPVNRHDSGRRRQLHQNAPSLFPRS